MINRPDSRNEKLKVLTLDLGTRSCGVGYQQSNTGGMPRLNSSQEGLSGVWCFVQTGRNSTYRNKRSRPLQLIRGQPGNTRRVPTILCLLNIYSRKAWTTKATWRWHGIAKSRPRKQLRHLWTTSLFGGTLRFVELPRQSEKNRFIDVMLTWRL